MSGKLTKSTTKPATAYGDVPYTSLRNDQPTQQTITSTNTNAHSKPKTIIGGLATAIALGFGGYAFMHTTGRDMGLPHYYNTLTDNGMAQARGDRVSFDPKDTSFQVTAKDTCLHTMPRNRSLVEICFRQGTEVRGEILAPTDKSQKPEWLTVKAHNADSNVSFWTTYIPLKDLTAAPAEPKAAITPAVKKLHHKPKTL